MKKITSLPGNLRALFGILRFLTVVSALVWILILAFFAWIPNLANGKNDKPKLLLTMGEVSLRSEPGAIVLNSNTAKPGSLSLVDLKGMLQLDLCTEDPALASALRWSTLPSIVVLAVFGWLFFGALKALCASIEQGSVFSEENLRLVRGIGWIIIGSSVVGLAVGFGACQVMGGYLAEHVTVAGIKTGLAFPGGAGAVRFVLDGGQIPFTGVGGLVTGCLVLMLSEAFKQGLALKTESELTV
jgi:hypothetical protein